MFILFLQVLFAAICTVSQAAVNVMLYSLLSRIFNKWFGFHIGISFFCSTYCLSKITSYVKRLWLLRRVKNKKRDDQIFLNELSWESPKTIAMRLVKTNISFKFYFKFIK
jgi:hypothetical protein